MEATFFFASALAPSQLLPNVTTATMPPELPRGFHQFKELLTLVEEANADGSVPLADLSPELTFALSPSGQPPAADVSLGNNVMLSSIHPTLTNEGIAPSKITQLPAAPSKAPVPLDASTLVAQPSVPANPKIGDFATKAPAGGTVIKAVDAHSAPISVVEPPQQQSNPSPQPSQTVPVVSVHRSALPSAPPEQSGTRQAGTERSVISPQPEKISSNQALPSTTSDTPLPSGEVNVSIPKVSTSATDGTIARSPIDTQTIPLPVERGPLPPLPSQPALAEGQSAAVSFRPLSASPTDQIRTAIELRGSETRIEVQLDPPELGRVQVEFEVVRQGTVRAVISAADAEVLDLLKRDADAFLQDLDTGGYEDVELVWEALESDQYTDEPDDAALAGRAMGPHKTGATEGTLDITL